MPDSLFGLDAGFPQFTGGESLSRKTDMMYDYMVQLQESLRYCLQNLDGTNFNPTGLLRIGETIRQPLKAEITDLNDNTALLWLTAEELATELTAADGRVSALSQKVDSLKLSVSNGAESSTIQLMADGAVISSQSIRLTGMVTVEDLKGEGTTEINGANIKTGTVTAVNIDGCRWSSTEANGTGIVIEKNAQRFMDGSNIAGQLYMDSLGTFMIATLSKYNMMLYSDNFMTLDAAGIMKLTAQTNMSLDAAENIYIGASEGYAAMVQLGNGSGTINLLGKVYVNGVQLGS